MFSQGCLINLLSLSPRLLMLRDNRWTLLWLVPHRKLRLIKMSHHNNLKEARRLPVSHLEVPRQSQKNQLVAYQEVLQVLCKHLMTYRKKTPLEK